MLIGLCGWPKAGKSVVRDILVKDHGFLALDTKVVIRKMAATLTGLEATDFVTQDDKEKLYNGVPRRVIMGELGNVAEKLWGDDFVIRRALEEGWIYPEKNIVVDSLRKSQPSTFPGFVIQIISNKAIITGNDFDQFYRFNTRAIIVNDGSYEELVVKVSNLLKELRS